MPKLMEAKKGHDARVKKEGEAEPIGGSTRQASG
jgi:hypothetical protein